MMESTMSTDVTTVNILTGTPTFGVQIRNLQDAVNDYKASGTVAWAKLIQNPFFTDTQTVISEFKNIFNQYGRSFYDLNFLDIIGAAFQCVRPVRNIFDSAILEGETVISNLSHAKFGGVHNWVFCSDLIAIIYRTLGIYSLNINPENYIPMNFLGYGTDLPKVIADPIFM